MRHKILFLSLIFCFAVLGLYAQESWSWFEGFEGDWPLSNWQMSGVARVSSTYSSGYGVPRTGSHSGTFCAGFSTSITDYIITPILLYPEGIFYFSKTNTGNNQVTVEYQEEDATIGPDINGTWETLGNYTSNTRWLPTYIDLLGYTNIYLRFRPTPPAPATKRYTYFDDFTVYEQNVPIELSSFTAVLSQELFVNLHWTTQSETQIAGYNLFRNENNRLYDAIKINYDLIPANNSSSVTNYEFQDKEVEHGNWYYWLQSMELDGSSYFYGPLNVFVNENGHNITPPIIPEETKLLNSYPNPFKSITNLSYTLKERGQPMFEIYNVRGQLIRTFLPAPQDKGYYQIVWDGKDLNGTQASSGVYYVRMTCGKYVSSQRLVLMK